MYLSKTEESKPFVRLGGCTTVAATPSTIAFKNIKENLKGNYIRLQKLPEFKKLKGDLPIALVGGGPDVKNHLEEIKKFKTIISCGSSHDFLIENHIIPTYSTLCDPDPVSINYLKNKHLEVKYLLASACDPKIYSHLKDCPIAMWHCHSDDYNDKMKEIEDPYEGVGGGCTIGLRSVSIALMFGYKNIHFFGFDSCLDTYKQGYAYELSSQEEKDAVGEIYQIKMGMGEDSPVEKIYHCAGYHLAQAEHFRLFLSHHGDMFNPTFHGEGLLPDLINMIQTEARKLRTLQ